jgi:cytochrome c oxidase cbb3-type subunit 3
MPDRQRRVRRPRVSLCLNSTFSSGASTLPASSRAFSRSRPSGQHSKRPWRFTAVLALAAFAIATTIVYARSANALRTRLLMAIPDTIPANAALDAYAMSRGAAAFAQHCASCHGERGQGDAVRGVPNLQDHDWLYGSGRIVEIERVVLYGIRSGNSKGWKLASMPAFATGNPYKLYPLSPLTPGAISDVTDYILSFQGRSADAAAIARGTKIYRSAQRGLCWDCHGERAQGNSAIGAPNLTDDIWLYGDGSRASIYNSIAYGHAGSCPAWISRLTPLTIRALAVYVHNLSATASAPPAARDMHE